MSEAYFPSSSRESQFDSSSLLGLCRDGNVIKTDEIPGVTTTSSSTVPHASSSSSSTTPSAPPFPGSGNTLGTTSSSSASNPSSDRPIAKRARSHEPAAGQNKYPEESIQALVGLGVGREEAVRLLDSTGGNTELAASLLFSQ